jgi:hypothetical protein
VFTVVICGLISELVSSSGTVALEKVKVIQKHMIYSLHIDRVIK